MFHSLQPVIPSCVCANMSPYTFHVTHQEKKQLLIMCIIMEAFDVGICFAWDSLGMEHDSPGLIILLGNFTSICVAVNHCNTLMKSIDSKELFKFT